MKTCILKVLMVLGLMASSSALDSAIAVRVPLEEYNKIQAYWEKKNAELEEASMFSRLDSLGINSRFYLDRLSCMESGGNYRITNKYGYLGKYQFSPRTLRSLVKTGYLSLSQHEIDSFLHIPSAQERAIEAFINASNDYLNRYNVGKYIGKRLGGVRVTREGLLAASHLVGPYAVVHFCKTGGSLDPVVLKSGVVVRKHDGNGVYLTEYMRKFSQVNV